LTHAVEVNFQTKKAEENQKGKKERKKARSKMGQAFENLAPSGTRLRVSQGEET